MKKLCAGLVLLLALMFAPNLSAQSPCGQVCQAYYPCDYACDLCVGDPGLWEIGGGCWGEIVQGTCGDIGQCGYVPEPTCPPQWVYDDPGSYQGSTPEMVWDPRCQWVFRDGQWVYECDYDNPWKCTVYDIFRVSRHQDNCYPPSSQTFCSAGYSEVIGYYPAPWEWACCADSNRWNCGFYFPQCP